MLALSQSVSKSYSRVTTACLLCIQTYQTTTTCLSCSYSPSLSPLSATDQIWGVSQEPLPIMGMPCPDMKVISGGSWSCVPGSGISTETPPTSTSLGHSLSFGSWSSSAPAKNLHSHNFMILVFAPITLSLTLPGQNQAMEPIRNRLHIPSTLLLHLLHLPF